jgi:hypothetical protein
MDAAAAGGHDMAKVYLWANRAGESELAAPARRPGAARELFAGLAEIYVDTKAARAWVTGRSVSAAAVVPAAAARRRRSRHAVTLVWPRPSQYSGGRPGPEGAATGCVQPG